MDMAALLAQIQQTQQQIQNSPQNLQNGQQQTQMLISHKYDQACRSGAEYTCGPQLLTRTEVTDRGWKSWLEMASPVGEQRLNENKGHLETPSLTGLYML